MIISDRKVYTITKSKLNPYLSFRDNAREAMEFYKEVFGGTLSMTTFKEGGDTHHPDAADQIMHAQLEADNGIVFMASDAPAPMDYKPGNTMSMSLSGDDEKELRGYWDKLSEGGTVTMPLEKAPWGDTFGMLIDKFGVSWMVNILAPKQ